MKRLLIIPTALLLLASATGCECTRWCRGGCSPGGTTAYSGYGYGGGGGCCNSCGTPGCSTCGPGGPGAMGGPGEPYLNPMPPMQVQPSPTPETYTPAPVNQ